MDSVGKRLYRQYYENTTDTLERSFTLHISGRTFLIGRYLGSVFGPVVCESAGWAYLSTVAKHLGL